MAELLLKEEVYRIVGAAMEVYNNLGCGFLEAVYQEAMEIELTQQEIPFEPQKQLTILYKGQPLRKYYMVDLLCYRAVIAELKVAERLTSADDAQLLNYLHATKLRVGVLLNFGRANGLEWKRMVV